MLFTVLGMIVVFTAPAVSAQDCQEDEVLQCLEPMLDVFQNITNNMVTGEINLAQLADTCPQFRLYQRCVNPRCLIPIFQDVNQVLMEAFTYICDEVFSDINRYRTCWTNPVVQSEYFGCGAQAAQVTITARDACQFFYQIERCLDDVTQIRCGFDQARLIRGYLDVVNARQKFDLQCLTTTPQSFTSTPQFFTSTPQFLTSTPQFLTSTPQFFTETPQFFTETPEIPGYQTVTPKGPGLSTADHIRCWECNSGMSRNSHALCPVNGRLTKDRLTSVMCTEACFVRTDRWNKNIIYRGCSKGHYLPKDMERTGCVENARGVVWCFCSRDRCNTQDMTAFLDERQ